jgi:hypothetical protein
MAEKTQSPYGPPPGGDRLGYRPAGSDGISIAPALDTVAAVPLPLPCESLAGPKSLERIAAVPATATVVAIITGTKSPRRSFL